MIIVLILLSVVGFIVCEVTDNYEFDWIFVVGGGLKIIVLAVLIGFIVNNRLIDDKIALYEEENQVIESQVETVVFNYMEYEQNTFTKCSSESAITLIDLYPELKTDTLVSKQIDVYVENNKEIRNLKTEKINISAYKWWAYFGK